MFYLKAISQLQNSVVASKNYLSNVVWTSGYNHLFVQIFDRTTIEIEGITVYQNANYQNAKLMDLVFVLDIPGGRATVKEAQIS